jgi:hypothetical protein
MPAPSPCRGYFYITENVLASAEFSYLMPTGKLEDLDYYSMMPTGKLEDLDYYSIGVGLQYRF